MDDDDDYFEREVEDPNYGWTAKTDTDWGGEDPYEAKKKEVEKERKEKEASQPPE